jgi:hypothetical protein
MFRGLFSEGFFSMRFDILSGSEDNLSGMHDARSLACFTARSPKHLRANHGDLFPLEKGRLDLRVP